MNVKCFIFLEIVVRLYYVVSYTVVLKQVKPLYQPVKVYRYDIRQPKISDGNFLHPYKPILGQKIYPVKGKNFRPRGYGKKDAKYLKNLPENVFQRDGRLYGISQQLVPPLSNQIEEYSEGKVAAEEDAPKEIVDVPPLPATPPPHEKSFSSFGQEKGKIHKNPGEWATPAPTEESDNSTQSTFTPSQLYLQIRHKNTVIHVPQSEALKDAETLEELINAPRLKELARTTHVQETYSEEGYEDAAYDHAGQIRQAQHGEVYDAKDEGRFKIKEGPIILDYDSDLEESKRLKNIETKEDNKLEPRITRSRTGVEEPPATYKGEHKFSSRVKIPKVNATEQSVGPVIFPSYFGQMPPPPDDILSPIKLSSKYRQEDLNSTKIYPVRSPTKEPYIDSQASPSGKSLKYSRIYSKKTKQLRLEPYKTGNVYSPPPPTELQPPVEVEEPSERIILPTIGYINSLTTAHFGKDVPKVQEEPKSELTSALNLTEALNFLRSNKDQKTTEEPKVLNETDLRTFEPMRLKKQRGRNFVNKTKRDVYLVKEGDDEEDAPHNEKNEEITEEERERIEEENREKERFEAELREEISAKEREIIKETFKNIRSDFPKGFPEDSSSELDFHYVRSTTPPPIDLKKYPFYRSKRLPENSPLRYASDPMTFPRKSGHGMEFYESRERFHCPDFHPDLGDLPDSNSSDNQAGGNPRLTSLGDKIQCLRSKYFDPEPFDNPIFIEKEIDYVGKPKKGYKKAQTKHKDSIKKTKISNRPHKTSATHNQHLIPIKLLPAVVEPVTEQSSLVTKLKWKTSHSKPSKVFLKKNCIHDISKIAALDGSHNVTIECNDATLIQEIINGAAYIRIIPKERWSAKVSLDESDWVPVLGYNHRKTNNVKVNNETTEKPTEDQYVIDELKEDKSVRQGEVVEDIDHYLKMADGVEVKGNGTRRRREAIDTRRNVAQRPTGNVLFDAIEKITGQINKTDESISKFFKSKRTLGRLSGKDFLTRYHKNKSKPKTADFWKIPTNKKPDSNRDLNNPETPNENSMRPKITAERKAEDKTQNYTKVITTISKEINEKPKAFKKYESAIEQENTSRVKKPEIEYKTINRNESENPSPVLYYVVDLRSGKGKWVTNYEEQRLSGKSRKSKENPGTRRNKKRKKAKY